MVAVEPISFVPTVSPLSSPTVVETPIKKSMHNAYPSKLVKQITQPKLAQEQKVNQSTVSRAVAVGAADAGGAGRLISENRRTDLARNLSVVAESLILFRSPMETLLVGNSVTGLSELIEDAISIIFY